MRYLQIVSLPLAQIASFNSPEFEFLCVSWRNIEYTKWLAVRLMFIHYYKDTVVFLYFSVWKLNHPAKLEQCSVINAFAVAGNNDIGVSMGNRCGEEVS